MGCSSRILILPTHCLLLKCNKNPFHMWEDPGLPGKGHGHHFVDCRKLTSYTWGWCSVWLTGRRLQSISVSVLCMRRQCAVTDPAMSSTPHSGHGIRLRSLSWYKSPTPVHFSAIASSDIPVCNAPGWQLIVRYFVMLTDRLYLQKILTRNSIACCSQPKLREPTMLSSA